MDSKDLVNALDDMTKDIKDDREAGMFLNPKVKPLRGKTMGLDALRVRVLDVLKKTRDQLHKTPYEDGLTDEEFIEQVLDTLEIEITQDIEYEKGVR